jgi:hypothetical protein
MRRHSQRGQSMVEATFVLLVFFTLLLGVIDCGQVLFAHQSLVERVRTAVRWGVVHPWNGSEPVVNLVLYNQPEPQFFSPWFAGAIVSPRAVSIAAPMAFRTASR